MTDFVIDSLANGSVISFKPLTDRLIVTARLAPPFLVGETVVVDVFSDVVMDVSCARRGDAGRGFGC